MNVNLRSLIHRGRPRGAAGGAAPGTADSHAFHHALPAALPQGLPVRDDELRWVEESIARLHREGALDAGNPFVLDAEIRWRRRQWDTAAESAAAQWIRAGRGHQGEIASRLASQLNEVAALRRRLERLTEEDTHWRGILLGAPVSPLPHPAPFDPDLVGRPQSHGMTITDIEAFMADEPEDTPGPEAVA